jgi:hypothetical protein
MLLQHALDILHDDDGVVDDDADCQHDGEQRNGIGRIADRVEHDEGADEAHRHGEDRDQRRADAAEEQEDDDDHQDEGFDQGLLHLVDRLLDEGGGVVGDLPRQVLGEGFFEVAQARLDAFERRDGVGAGRLIKQDDRRGRTVEARLAVEIGGAEFQPRHIAEAQDRAIGIRPDDDLLELLDRGETAGRLDIELELLFVGDRLGADAPHRRLHVLRLDRGDDVARGQAKARQAVGSQPGAHRVILGTRQHRIADTRRALDLIEDVDGDVVGDEQRIVGALGRIDGNDAEHGRGFLLDADTLALHFLRQFRQCHLDTVVEIDRVDVGIGAKLERGREGIAAVIAADAFHIHHLVDADGLRLDRLRHGRIDDGGGGTRIGGRDRDLRRHDVGILRDGDDEQRQQPADDGHDRNDDGQARPVDENG